MQVYAPRRSQDSEQAALVPQCEPLQHTSAGVVNSTIPHPFDRPAASLTQHDELRAHEQYTRTEMPQCARFDTCLVANDVCEHYGAISPEVILQILPRRSPGQVVDKAALPTRRSRLLVRYIAIGDVSRSRLHCMARGISIHRGHR
jgi:hypothetical protein